jgi:hypothetical protein
MRKSLVVFESGAWMMYTMNKIIYPLKHSLKMEAEDSEMLNSDSELMWTVASENLKILSFFVTVKA